MYDLRLMDVEKRRGTWIQIARIPSIADLPTQATITNNLREQLIPPLQRFNAILIFNTDLETKTVFRSGFGYSGHIVPFKCPQRPRSDRGLEHDAAGTDAEMPVMKMALLILGRTVRSPDMDLQLFGTVVVVVGLRVTWYIFDIFAANPATSHRFNGLACFHLDARDGPFGYRAKIGQESRD